jgi:hypothetical protein
MRLAYCDEHFVQSAPYRFVNVIRCATSPDTAFDVISNSEFDEEWFPDFVSAEWKTPPPYGVGSKRLYKLKYMTILEEFLTWERGRRLVFRVSYCSLPIVRRFLENYEIRRDAEGRTEITWQVCYEPNPWLRFLHPLLRPLFAKDFSKAANQLEALLARIEDKR